MVSKLSCFSQTQLVYRYAAFNPDQTKELVIAFEMREAYASQAKVGATQP
jgi:hypothetical protein